MSWTTLPETERPADGDVRSTAELGRTSKTRSGLAYDEVRYDGYGRRCCEVFAGHSEQVGAGDAVCDGERPVLETGGGGDSMRVDLVMPNLHYIPIDVSRFGQENANDIFVPTPMNPHGLIRGPGAASSVDCFFDGECGRCFDKAGNGRGAGGGAMPGAGSGVRRWRERRRGCICREPMQRVHALLSGMDGGCRSCRVRVDAAGNLRGVYGDASGPDGPRLMVGSHLDTVPNAGAFDGVLGVVMGLAVVEQMTGGVCAAPDPLPFAVEVVGFSEEEGVRFGRPFLGSVGDGGRTDQ